MVESKLRLVGKETELFTLRFLKCRHLTRADSENGCHFLNYEKILLAVSYGKLSHKIFQL